MSCSPSVDIGIDISVHAYMQYRREQGIMQYVFMWGDEDELEKGTAAQVYGMRGDMGGGSMGEREKLNEKRKSIEWETGERGVLE